MSCKEKYKAQAENKSDTKTILENKEWFDFIDSVYTYPFQNMNSIDSISLYFMKVKTPNVLATPKYIFWKDTKSVKSGEFNVFIPTSYGQFLIVSYDKRNLILNKIELDTSTIKESTKVLLDLNNDEALKNPCNQISNVEKKVANQNIVFNIEIFQSCLDEYSNKQLIYPFP